MNKFKIANISLALIGVSLGTPMFAHSDEIVCGTTYVVERADSLSNISEWAYGTARRVDEIYAANADQIGPDRSVLLLGMELNIPCIDGEELVASTSGTEAAEQPEAAAAETETAAAQAEPEATATLAAAQVAAAAEAQAAEVDAAAALEASAATEDTTEDLMAMSEELLTIEGFDADKVVALIDTLDLPDSEKTTLSNAVIAAEGNPAWLRAMLTIISDEISR
ncbi:LysM peptidoglycan-binding domain-containing protein [Yoonia sp. F2084L]|uniref:LysM peptidoglycan-binding domain-containing protein n=1 Tax=Yoonia sp. F2084L TaxID=2926419 RepID=UPI001FF2678F|nr:LysM domain-containing protein [Yoonia sp. F2084L]MCK0095209.1 LysM peptidoglycan-binding domain-containing protein [Yoonia sp. F2084L]